MAGDLRERNSVGADEGAEDAEDADTAAAVGDEPTGTMVVTVVAVVGCVVMGACMSFCVNTDVLFVV